MKQPFKRLNIHLTNWIICLHQSGYTIDFSAVDKEHVRCIQSGECFSTQYLRINLVHCGYDILTRCYQYIHTIDTQTGYRGLLITNGIMPLTASLPN